MVPGLLRASLPALLLTVLLSAAPAGATDLWTPIGPGGGEVNALAVAPSNPDVLYTGTRGGGIYKSVNGAATWTAASGGLTNLTVLALAVHPRNPEVAYAATLGDGVFKTANGGASWAHLSFPSLYPFSLAIDPRRPSIVYAGTIAQGVLKSRDGGVSWLAANQGLEQATVRSIAIHPRQTSIVYMAVEAGPRRGVFKSTNGGQTWQAMNDGLPDFSSGSGVISVAIDPTNPNIVYALPVGGKIHRSTNGGRSWTPTPLGNASPIAVGPTGILWAGASQKSFDKGNTVVRSRWPDRFPAQTIAVDPRNANVVYAGHVFDGVSKTADGGASWQQHNQGLWASTIVTLVAASDHPTHVYATLAGQGFFRTWSGGATWWRRRTPWLEVTELAVDPIDPSTLYGVLSGGDLEKSPDRGKSWEHQHPADPDCFEILDLAVDPVDSENVYAVGTVRNGRCPELCTAYRSPDAGASWTCMSGASGASLLEIDPHDPSILYAFPGELRKSIDQGNQWTQIGQGLPDSLLSLAIDPLETATLYAGTLEGVYKSVDGGLTWIRSSAGLPTGHIVSLAIHPGNPNVIYAGLADTSRDAPTPGITRSDIGVYRSTDGGATWSRFGQGLPPALFNGLLAIDPAPPYTLYAGTNDGGVYKLVP
jgi:photosystem II stability/assembly factor-like uncharacterized protein